MKIAQCIQYQWKKINGLALTLNNVGRDILICLDDSGKILRYLSYSTLTEGNCIKRIGNCQNMLLISTDLQIFHDQPKFTRWNNNPTSFLNEQAFEAALSPFSALQPYISTFQSIPAKAHKKSGWIWHHYLLILISIAKCLNSSWRVGVCHCYCGNIWHPTVPKGLIWANRMHT